MAGKKAQKIFVWWKGKAIPYNSDEHRQLIKRAIEAKYEQNFEAMEALLSTKGKKITHEIGPESPYTSLPKEIFCRILKDIRDKKLQEMKQ